MEKSLGLPPSEIAYRTEIDGLRMVAVLPVILFHAGISWAQGGFVGVDIFFVISGYLITGVLISDLDKQRFSILRFYERRVRRILPALFLVTLVCIPFALLLMSPQPLKEFSRSVAASTLSVSNILFWKESAYFELSADLKPLLHTWSLGVEEQFYLLYPLLLALLWKRARRFAVPVLAILAVLSLAAAEWASAAAPNAAFYLLPFRAWELLLGALAMLLAGPRPVVLPHRLDAAGATLGLALIAGSILLIGEESRFPGFAALYPTVGAVLVILFAAPSNPVGWLLSRRVCVWIGLISYSAYLWHQPLLAFFRLAVPAPPGPLGTLGLVAVTFALAHLTWRFVERPFRDRKFLSVGQLFGLAAVAGGVLVLLGAGGHFANGFAKSYYGRLTPAQGALFAVTAEAGQKALGEGTCLLTPDQRPDAFVPACFAQVPAAQRVVLWGDSHAAALAMGLRDAGLPVEQLSSEGCAPVLELEVAILPNCRDFNAYMLKRVAETRPGTLLIDADWYSHDRHRRLDGLGATLAAIRHASPGTRVVLIGNVPQWSTELPHAIVATGRPVAPGLRIPNGLAHEIAEGDARLRSAAAANGIAFVSLMDDLCRDAECVAVVADPAGPRPLLFDSNHLTPAASRMLAARLVPMLSPAASPSKQTR